MTSTETASFDARSASARPLRLNLEHRDRADSMLRWLSGLALCTVLCQCGSSDSEGLFGSEDGAGATAARGAEAVPASSEPVNEASAPASPKPAEPIPAEASAARGQDAPGPNEPAPTPAKPDGEPAAPDVPDAVSVIQIERARWGEDDAELEVRGVVSSPTVTLSLRFLERAEPLLNENGAFRGEFSAVEDNPEQVTLTASDGGTATARVEVD